MPSKREQRQEIAAAFEQYSADEHKRFLGAEVPATPEHWGRVDDEAGISYRDPLQQKLWVHFRAGWRAARAEGADQ